jgi:hypothetical protein
VKRWLAAPLQRAAGTLVERDKGTPQGSAISPILANLFMRCAVDRGWPGTTRTVRLSAMPFVTCVSRTQAENVLAAIAARMQEVSLRLHPDKTRMVYCKDSNRRGEHEHTSFSVLGYAFRYRAARRKDGVCFTSFSPAISPEALKATGADLRKLWIHRRTDLSLDAWRDG